MEKLYTDTIEEITNGHVFYQFQDEDIYLEKLMSFIQSGIINDQQILIIENLRVLPKLREKINEVVSNEQQSSIRLVNNFEYYLSNGDFHTETIIKNFQANLNKLKKSNSTVRTWAHVEWTSSEPNIELIKEFESVADHAVRMEKTLSVCAYSTNHLNTTLISTLEELHQYVMTDDTFMLSTSYKI